MANVRQIVIHPTIQADVGAGAAAYTALLNYLANLFSLALRWDVRYESRPKIAGVGNENCVVLTIESMFNATAPAMPATIELNSPLNDLEATEQVTGLEGGYVMAGDLVVYFATSQIAADSEQNLYMAVDAAGAYFLNIARSTSSLSDAYTPFRDADAIAYVPKANFTAARVRVLGSAQARVDGGEVAGRGVPLVNKGQTQPGIVAPGGVRVFVDAPQNR